MFRYYLLHGVMWYDAVNNVLDVQGNTSCSTGNYDKIS